MGHVYLARDPRLGNRRVAIQAASRRQRGSPPSFRAGGRFRRQLHHRNIVVIYEYGDHEGQPYIAMEFIERGPA
jgi:serine/threonine-protein kinase